MHATLPLQVNLGYRCNQSCMHCHVAAGPNRTEEMSRPNVEAVLAFMASHRIATLDLTGGAPELHPLFREIVSRARALSVRAIDRCNLTILEEPGQEGLAEFLARERVEIVASLPCYLEENVDRQRGKGVFEASIRGLHQLNALGYGREESGLILNLVYNPQGPSLPPPQESASPSSANRPASTIQPATNPALASIPQVMKKRCFDQVSPAWAMRAESEFVLARRSSSSFRPCETSVGVLGTRYATPHANSGDVRPPCYRARMPRLARAVAPGLPHHVTQRGNRRQKAFFSTDDYLLYLALMSEWCDRYGVDIWAYCLMPNHVHLIAVPPDEKALRWAIGEANRHYARAINQRQGWRGYLWQGRFASVPMDEGHTLAAARYVELNPVRARLADTPEGWAWSSARVLRPVSSSAKAARCCSAVIAISQRPLRGIDSMGR